MERTKVVNLLIVLVLLVVWGFAVPGFAATENDDRTTREDVQQETRELMEALRSYGADQRGEARAKAQKAMANIDARTKTLEGRILENWDKMSQAAREKAGDNLEALREQREKVAEWYDRLASGSATVWEQVKKGFSDAYSSLAETWEKSTREFESGEANGTAPQEEPAR